MTLEQAIDDLMDASRTIAEVAESESDEANRINAQNCADDCEQLAAWLRELQEIRKDRDYWEEKAHSYEQTIHKLTDAISKQPEIIRCKDCQYFGIDGQKLYCRMWQSYTAENGYCHLAEKAGRRTNADD